MSKIHFDTIALIGIGLIGSSLARVIKREGLAGHDRRFHPQPKHAGSG